ncbi:GCN5 family acetyltransferase (fragment) [Cupriavidus necator]|uniref:GCN5 family acetyltransferase n=1 Tax=Cupriavidus necator TaxID=106590 RepID=A0A1K0ISR0_CUPNE
MLTAIENLASARGIEQVIAGVNTARHDAYQMMRERD